MVLILCFLYIFFTVVLGLYLGLELISVRRADRMARTLFKAAVRAAQAEAAQMALEPSADAPVPPNYFKVK